MIYDELLDNIYWHWRYVEGNDGLQAMTDYRRMILAVVELHKPTYGFETGHCLNCAYVGGELMPYPCPTIQAIEKELK